MSKKSAKPSKKPTEKTISKIHHSEDSLSNLSAIIANEKDTKFKKLHKLVMERIEGIKKR